MILGVVLKNGKEIDRGICTGGKKFNPDYPEQYISIADEADAYEVKNERTYHHDGSITFHEYQDNDNGWELVYDSQEKIDRTVNYPLPSWFANSDVDIPDFHHRLNEDGFIEAEFRGYIK